MERKPVPYREKVKMVIIQVNHNCFTRLCFQWRPRRRGRRLEQGVSGIAFDENERDGGGLNAPQIYRQPSWY
jgi:hypothetical protein